MVRENLISNRTLKTKKGFKKWDILKQGYSDISLLYFYMHQYFIWLYRAILGETSEFA